MHALLSQEAETSDIILFQEPWWGWIGGNISDKHTNLEAVMGTVQHPSWTPFLPFQAAGSWRPRAITFVAKAVLAQYSYSSRPDIISSEDVQCLEVASCLNQDMLLIINVYNDPLLVNNGALTRILPFRLSTQIPIIMAGDFNLHHLLWSAEGMATSPQAEDFTDWINDNGFVLFNCPAEFTFFHWNAAYSPTVIDLTFANVGSLIRGWDIPTAKQVGSDHCTLAWDINRTFQDEFELPNFSIKDKNKEDWTASFKRELAVSLPSHVPNSTAYIDQAAFALQNAVLKAMEETMTWARISRWSMTWWNPEINKIMTDLREVKTKVKDTYHNGHIPSADLCSQVSKLENRKKKAIRASKASWISQRMSDTDTKDIWQMAKWFCGIQCYKIPVLSHNGNTATTNTDKCMLLHEVFFPEVTTQVTACSTGQTTEQPFVNIMKSEVAEALTTCKNTSAPGRSSIGYKLIKWAWQIVSEEILLLFQSCLTVGHHPLIWKDTIAVVIPKPNKSDYSAAKAYRPISLLKCFSKLLEKIVARRLTFDAGQHNLIPPRIHPSMMQHSWLYTTYREHGNADTLPQFLCLTSQGISTISTIVFLYRCSKLKAFPQI
jgi:Endonuclease-reverse transcriptase